MADIDRMPIERGNTVVPRACIPWTPVTWTRKQASLLAVVCLLAGVAGGWMIRAIRTPAATASAGPSSGAGQLPSAPNPAGLPNPARLREMADAQAAPSLDKLKSDPNNPDLLTAIGNVYYDAQQYPVAIDFYGRALKAKPSDSAVRTDMATAYWYTGNADAAIAQFDQALTYAPTNPNTLFNRGLVKWQGKSDAAGALADWQKLLATNPGYEARPKVEEMMAQVRAHAAVKQ